MVCIYLCSGNCEPEAGVIIQSDTAYTEFVREGKLPRKGNRVRGEKLKCAEWTQTFRLTKEKESERQSKKQDVLAELQRRLCRATLWYPLFHGRR